jgi:hypothetical protein
VSEKIVLLDDYIQRCASSRERTQWVAKEAERLQVAEWEKRRLAISERDAEAPAKVAAFISSIGLQGHYALSDAQNAPDMSARLAQSYKAARCASYLKTLPDSVTVQFPTKAETRDEALRAITEAQKLLTLNKVSTLLLACIEEIQKSRVTLDKIAIQSQAINLAVGELKTSFRDRYAVIQSSLDLMDKGLADLNKISQRVTVELSSGFTEAATHIKSANKAERDATKA